MVGDGGPGNRRDKVTGRVEGKSDCAGRPGEEQAAGVVGNREDRLLDQDREMTHKRGVGDHVQPTCP